MRSYDATSRRAAAERNRAAVIDACWELVLAHGYRATTVKAIAQRAGVSPELIYKVFGGKKQVMKAVYDVAVAGDHDQVSVGERAQMQSVFAAQDLDTKLALYAWFVLGVYQRLGALIAVLAEPDPDLTEILTTISDERLTGIANFLTHLAAQGLIPPDTRQATDICWLLTSPAVYLKLTCDRSWPPDQYTNWVTKMLKVNLAGEAAV